MKQSYLASVQKEELKDQKGCGKIHSPNSIHEIVKTHGNKQGLKNTA